MYDDPKAESRLYVYRPSPRIKASMAAIGAQRPRCSWRRSTIAGPSPAAALTMSAACQSSGPVRRRQADDRGDDPTLAEIVARDLVDDPSARHHDHAIAQTRQLDRVAGLDDDGGALGRLLAQRGVDVEPGADVDALGGFVGEDQLEIVLQERAQQCDLLLVAAGQIIDRLLDRCRFQAEPSHHLVDRLRSLLRRT